MKAISLFSGVGGFDLGFQKAGIETVLQAEQDKHALAVLARHWPDVERVSDVRDVGVCAKSAGGSAAAGEHSRHTQGRTGDARAELLVDVIFGGFPCQDISVAGKRAGLSGERSGLWFEFARIIGELRPRWCVIENVPGLFSSNEGRDFAVILDGLDELGYGVAWRVLDAQHFGVPQRRRRVFIVGGPGDGTAAAAVLAVRESGGGDSQESRETREDLAATLSGATAELGGETANALRGSQGGGDKPYALIANAISASAGHHGHSSPRGDGSDNLVIPFDTTQITSAGNYSNPQPGDPMHPLAAGAHVPAIAYEVAPTIDAQDGRKWGSNQWVNNGKALVATAVVRRLTPLECERLMGFPDGWTDLPQADSHRYRQLGNAVVVPVAHWIGLRLMRVNELLSS